MRPVRDSRGIEIKEGALVAYNRSGDVIEGTVLYVTPGAVRIKPHIDFLQGRSHGSASRVRNPRSILVLAGPV